MKVLSVSQVNRYIKSVLDMDFVLNSIFVEGEVSNFKSHSSGHLYFSLKDSFCSIDCVMFRDYASCVPFSLENGLSIVVFGYVSVYEKIGHFQLYAVRIEPLGVGSLHVAFEQLKALLDKEGLFLASHKKTIPLYSKRVAVVTSPSGAAVRDIISVALRRNRNAQLVIVPVLVQGDGAAAQIADAIDMINSWGGADVIIVTRGGGSAEDLWAFNEVIVARAIFNSSIPVVSAVGHETDYTIADFVADLRAPTPSAAAELCFFDLNGCLNSLSLLMDRMKSAVNAIIAEYEHLFALICSRHVFKHPDAFLLNNDLYVSSLMDKINVSLNAIILSADNRFNLLLERIELLSPLTVLRRGFCLALDCDGRVIKSVSEVSSGSILKIKLHDGFFIASVEGKGDSYAAEKIEF